jgi:hypothetical protein
MIAYPGEQKGLQQALEDKRDDLVANYLKERDELLAELLPEVGLCFLCLSSPSSLTLQA